jgi:DNA-binding LacI/PurR family transcriptional regulator
MAQIERIPGRTLQEQVMERIVARIRTGELAVGDPLMPERQLSEDLGVSRITVVRALDRLEREGWVSRQQGRGTFVCEPAPPRGPTLALMAAVPAHPSLFRSLIGMSEVVNAANGQLRLLGRFEGLGSERDMADRALRDGADGLIVYPDTGTRAPPLYSELAAQGVPLVLIDRYFPDLATDRVVYDDAAAGTALCGRLFDAGARRIAVLPHREFDVTSVQDRIAGAGQAAAHRGLPPDSVVVWTDVYADFSPSRPQADRQENRLGRLRARLDAASVDGLFAINGDIAERLSRDLEALAARDGDTARDAGAGPRLCACVHQFVQGPGGQPVLMAHEAAEDLGRRAAEILIGRITGTDTGPPRILRVAMRIDPAA